MTRFFTLIWVECLKVKRSKVFWLTIGFFSFIPLMIGLLMFVQKNPELASKFGMIGSKASMMRFGEANWINFLGLINQTVAAIGLIGFGFVTSWIYGREYSDNTIKDILALPVSRSNIVLSKFVLVFIWCTILSFIFLVFTIIVGFIIDISGWSIEALLDNVYKYIIISFLSILLCTPVAFFASYSRGYFLPLGFVILTLIIANFTGLVGLGPYFPWAIPGIYSVSVSSVEFQLHLVSYFILFITSIIGIVSTIAWWNYADQK